LSIASQTLLLILIEFALIKQMTIDDFNPTRCVYCDNLIASVSKGEHIVAQTIGGRLTINDRNPKRNVCNICNNGILSELDVALCSSSPLTIVACHVISRDIFDSWDILPGSNNLLVEGSSELGKGSHTYYPQIIFEADGKRLMICDAKQMEDYGMDRFQDDFSNLVQSVIEKYQKNKKRVLWFSPTELPSGLRDMNCRYPPRIYARCSIEKLCSTKKLHLRYLTPEDKAEAMTRLLNWNHKKFEPQKFIEGSDMPWVRANCDVGKTLRALLKLGINLLAAFCERTLVGVNTFSKVISIIMGQATFDQTKAWKHQGFLWAEDIQSIRAEGNAHSFRLLYIEGHWLVFSSFFGGRIGTFVSLEGPNNEDWCSADIVAPLGSKKWMISTSNILLPLPVHINWTDHKLIMPSMPLLNAMVEERFSTLPTRS
jgi:hypothetical protein